MGKGLDKGLENGVDKGVDKGVVTGAQQQNTNLRSARGSVQTI